MACTSRRTWVTRAAGRETGPAGGWPCSAEQGPAGAGLPFPGLIWAGPVSWAGVSAASSGSSPRIPGPGPDSATRRSFSGPATRANPSSSRRRRCLSRGVWSHRRIVQVRAPTPATSGHLPGGCVMLVPHAAGDSSEVDADPVPDAEFQEHHHGADGAIALVIRNNRLREQEGGEHGETGDAERCGQGTREQQAPACGAEQQEVHGPPPKERGDDEPEDEDDDVASGRADLTAGQYLEPDVTNQSRYPDEIDDELFLHCRRRRYIEEPLVPQLKGARDGDRKEHQNYPPDHSKTPDRLVPGRNEAADVLGGLCVET